MLDGLRSLLAWFRAWIDAAAAGFSGLFAPFRRARAFALEENEDGTWVLHAPRRRGPGAPIGKPWRFEDGQFIEAGGAPPRAFPKGAQVDLLLRPSRFIFRPLDLPRQAGGFLDGVVRAQIDRLTPWPANAVAFGTLAPAPLGADRLSVTVAATARATIIPFVDALVALHADAVQVSTTADLGSAPRARDAPITVLTRAAGAERRLRLTRNRLIFALALAALACAGAGAAAAYYGPDLDGRLDDLKKRIAMRRAELISGRGSATDEAVAALGARKHATAPGVIVVEALAQALPDDTYLSELRIESGKVQIAGLTRDAPSLINLIEQSKRFTRATFFAPTTRSATDDAERFHIEAHIEPMEGPQ